MAHEIRIDDHLVDVLKDIHDAEQAARQQGNTELADRFATQRRKLLEPPPADVGQLLTDIAEGFELMLETSDMPEGTFDHTMTRELIDEARETAKQLEQRRDNED